MFQVVRCLVELLAARCRDHLQWRYYVRFNAATFNLIACLNCRNEQKKTNTETFWNNRCGAGQRSVMFLVCVCVCVIEVANELKQNEKITLFKHEGGSLLYEYMYMCVCVCVYL